MAIVKESSCPDLSSHVPFATVSLLSMPLFRKVLAILHVVFTKPGIGVPPLLYGYTRRPEEYGHAHTVPGHRY